MFSATWSLKVETQSSISSFKGYDWKFLTKTVPPIPFDKNVKLKKGKVITKQILQIQNIMKE